MLTSVTSSILQNCFIIKKNDNIKLHIEDKLGLYILKDRPHNVTARSFCMTKWHNVTGLHS